MTGITVGENGGSPPTGQRLFVWKDLDSSKEIIGMWHPKGYGGVDRFHDCVIAPNGIVCFMFSKNSQL